MLKSIIFALTVAAVAPFGIPDARAQSGVAVSIKPVHSLVAGVMQGVGEPYLLIPGSASPHNYTLKPSDAQALEQAKVVFWIGEGLETFMEKPLEALADKARVVELAEAPGVELLAIREGGNWEGHVHGEHHDHGHDHGEKHAHGHDHAHGEHDMHIWLDPENAKAIVAHVVAVLSEADPGNAETYARNGADVTSRLDELTTELRGMLAPVSVKPFLVFHDAYQYFEARFGLNSVGAITVSPGVQPSAQRVSEIRERIASLSVACIFAEPQLPPRLIEVVTEGTDVRAGVLDPLGADIAEGPDHYFDLMRQNARALVACLSAQG